MSSSATSGASCITALRHSRALAGRSRNFRAGGGTVILVSNAPVPKHRVADMLESRHVPQSAWDDIVSSGDIALAHVEERGFTRLHCIGPQDRDQALFRALKARSVPLARGRGHHLHGPERRQARKARRLSRPARRSAGAAACRSSAPIPISSSTSAERCSIAPVRLPISTPIWAAPFTGPESPTSTPTRPRTARPKRFAMPMCPRDKILVIGDSLRTDMKGAETFGCGRLVHRVRHPSARDDGRNQFVGEKSSRTCSALVRRPRSAPWSSSAGSGNSSSSGALLRLRHRQRRRRLALRPLRIGPIREAVEHDVGRRRVVL